MLPPGCPALLDLVGSGSDTAVERPFSSGTCVTVLWRQSAQEKLTKLHFVLRGLVAF